MAKKWPVLSTPAGELVLKGVRIHNRLVVYGVADWFVMLSHPHYKVASTGLGASSWSREQWEMVGWSGGWLLSVEKNTDKVHNGGPGGIRSRDCWMRVMQAN